MNLDFIYRDETRQLDDAARRAVGGAFIRLSRGWTHFETMGPARGHAVVLIHGFSVPYFIWEPTVRALASAGLTVTRYDLYGRGYSDRPHVNYDMALFLDQLLELLEVLGYQTVDLIGLSMGGAIAAALTVGHGNRVRRLVLIDPVGARPMPLSPFYKVAMVPGLSEIVLGLLGTKQMVRGIAADFFQPVEIELLQSEFRVQTEFRGFKRAIISSLRHHMLGSFREVYERLGGLGTPVLLIWGQNDRSVPFAQSNDMLKLLPDASFFPVAGCGHIPHYEKPEEVNARVLEFLEAV